MRKTQKLAAMMTAVLLAGSMSASTLYAADNAFRIDEINWTQEDWACIAMTNDDTVETGAVIRTEANADSAAAGYLYRGAGAKVVSKGEEWTLIESGKVTGYVKNEFLMFGDEARGLAAHYGKQGVAAKWDDVQVFSDNSADASVSKTLDDGAVLGMVQDNGHWICVQKDKDSAGYVSEEDVSRVLLVDTAVPAQGEDDADVPATMTAADVPSDTGASAQTVEYAAAEAAPEAEWDDAGTEYAEYTETASETDGSGETYTAEHVSDDPTIQALYEAYIEAQNAAMNCTSEEDAQAKAAAATAAWNAYLAACNGTSVSAEDSASDDSSSDEDVWEESDEEDDWYEEDEEDDGWYEEEEEEDDWYEDEEEEEDTSAAEAAAQSTNSGSYAGYSDLDLLAAIIWCEAGNQSYDGMVAVGQVVMNRVKSSSFPNTIAEVLNQPGQFTPASSGTLQAALAAGINSTCYSAATDALNGSAPVPGTPLYFNTHSGSYKLGAHYFS